MIVLLILGLSILVQGAAAVLAFRLNRRYGRQGAWTLISIAIAMMTLRRCLTFYQIAHGDLDPSKQWFGESAPLLTSAALSLGVSVLLLIGVALIHPLFRRIKEAESLLAGEKRGLEQVVAENEAEFRLARRVQQHLYPKGDPQVDGLDISGQSIPARSASGDYFDYLKLEDGTLGIVVGDACGHGMGAALLITETRAFLRAFAKVHNDPAQILTLTNRSLCEDTTGGQFVTLLLVKIDPATRMFVCVTAGHPGYLLRACGKVETLEDQNLPLAVDRNTKYVCQPARTMAPGDVLLFCTDGLWESWSPDGLMFGLDRVWESVGEVRVEPAARIVTSLFEAVSKFSQATMQCDDITAVIVKEKR